MVAKAENGHVNIQELFKFNFIATFNIRSPEKDSEKNTVLCKKVTTLPHLRVLGFFSSRPNWDPTPLPLTPWRVSLPPLVRGECHTRLR
jgi:hypothetical protein